MALEKGRSEGEKTVAKWTHEDRKHFVDLGERMIANLLKQYNNGELMDEKRQIPLLFSLFDLREVQRQYGKAVINYTKNRLTNRYIAISQA